MRIILVYFILLIFIFSCNDNKIDKKCQNAANKPNETEKIILKGSIFCVSNNKLYLNLYTNENGCRLNLIMDSLLKQNVLEQYEANIGLLPNYQCLEATVYGYFLQNESERLYLYKRYDFYVLSLDWTDSKMENNIQVSDSLK
jgi:hypothetical protein